MISMKRHHRASLDAYDEYARISGSSTVPSDSTTTALYWPYYHQQQNLKELFYCRRHHHQPHDHNRHRHQHHHHHQSVTVSPRGWRARVLQRRLHREVGSSTDISHVHHRAHSFTSTGATTSEQLAPRGHHARAPRTKPSRTFPLPPLPPPLKLEGTRRHHHRRRYNCYPLDCGVQSPPPDPSSSGGRHLSRVVHQKNYPPSVNGMGSNFDAWLEKYHRFMEWSMLEEELERAGRGVSSVPSPVASPQARSVTWLPPHPHATSHAMPPHKPPIPLGGSVDKDAPRGRPALRGRQGNSVLDGMMSDLVSRGVVPNPAEHQERPIREASGNLQQAADNSAQKARKLAMTTALPQDQQPTRCTELTDPTDDLELCTSKSYILSIIDRALRREVPTPPTKKRLDTNTTAPTNADSGQTADPTGTRQLPPKSPRSRKSNSGSKNELCRKALLEAGDNEFQGVKSAPPSPHPFTKTPLMGHGKDATTMTGLEKAVHVPDEDKVQIDMDVDVAIDLVSSDSANMINPDLCMKITRMLTDTLLERPPPPRCTTMPPPPCGTKQSASPRIALDRSRCAVTSDPTTNVLRIPSGQEPVYMRQLKELRWDHIRHIQREVLRLEQLERFLDTCDGGSGRAINTSFSSPV